METPWYLCRKHINLHIYMYIQKLSFLMKISRRNALSAMALGSAGLAVPASLAGKEVLSPSKFSYCLNTSTISGNNPGLLSYIKIASSAGTMALRFGSGMCRQRLMKVIPCPS